MIEGGSVEDNSSTVFIVDDDIAVREMLEAMLGQHGYKTAAYASAHAFLADYASSQAGCLVLDICIPEMSGLELQKELTKREYSIPIVFITGSGTIEQSVQAVKAGALDFIEKPFRTEKLIERIKEALILDSQMRSHKHHNESLRQRFRKLTDRELDVLYLLVSGNATLSNKDIAAKLSISHRTVDHHRSRIMEKTNTQSLTELARLVDRAKLSEPAIES